MEPTNTRATLGQARSGCVTPAAKNSSNLLTCDVIKIRPLWSVILAAHCDGLKSLCRERRKAICNDISIFRTFAPSILGSFRLLFVSFFPLSSLCHFLILFFCLSATSSSFFILVLLLFSFLPFLICFRSLVTISSVSLLFYFFSPLLFSFSTFLVFFSLFRCFLSPLLLSFCFSLPFSLFFPPSEAGQLRQYSKKIAD